MTGPALVVASPRVRVRRRADLDRHPDALDGIFVPGAQLIGEPGTFSRDELTVALAAARRLAELPHPTAVLVPATGEPVAADWQQPDRYRVAAPGFAALLTDVRTSHGAVPRWLQHLVVDQLVAYLVADSALYTVTAGLPAELTAALHDALGAIVPEIEDDVIAAHRATDEIRMALLLGARGRTGHTPARTVRDAGRGLQRVSYFFYGPAPVERYVVAGVQVQPQHHKIRSIEFFGAALLYERIAWLAADATVQVAAAGQVTVPASPPPSRLARYRRVLAENRGVAARVAGDVYIKQRARRPQAVARYRDAWLLMDRDTAAQDNAEHLYRHLRAHEPDVNAWFVLAAGSAEWDRLHGDGFRLLAYGSREHFVALLNCAHLISSQVDSYVTKPFRKHALGRPRWRYTFLQHGVIKDDLSRWLNGKPIDVFVTSTADEQAGIVADGSPYVFTDLETVLTGLARHDRLLALAGTGAARRLLVMPTWRRELLGEQTAGNRRALLDTFWDSDYALGWRELLESDELRALCERAAWQLTFVPHPNMQGYLDTSPLPEHVVALRFDDIDVQELLADAAAVVTDYSSLATEAAYIERPVVYYQFDRAAFFAGGHVYRRGSWSYEEQGFGPVTGTAADALAALGRIAQDGKPEPRYVSRMQQTFAFRDGRCCERTVAAIKAIGRQSP